MVPEYTIPLCINREVNRIDGLDRMNNDPLTKFREYRQALISAPETR